MRMSKAIAIIDKPDSCQKCWFSVCHYSLPLSTRRKGYSCRIQNYDNGVVVEDFDYDEEVHLKNCPLKPMPEKIGIEEALKMPRNGCIGDVINTYNACIDEILGDKE